MDNRIKLLIAVGSSVTANCQPCLEHLIEEAQDSGAEKKEILETIAITKIVRRGAMSKMDKFTSTLIGNVKAVAEDSENGCGCT